MQTGFEIFFFFSTILRVYSIIIIDATQINVLRNLKARIVTLEDRGVKNLFSLWFYAYLTLGKNVGEFPWQSKILHLIDT